MKKLLMLSALTLCFPTFAEDPYQQCLDKAGASTEGIMELCADKASEIYKKEITKSYNVIFTHYRKNESEKAKPFEEAQKAWLMNRNKNCEISDNKANCLMVENQQRAEELSIKASKLQAPSLQVKDYYNECHAGHPPSNAVTFGCMEEASEQYKKDISKLYKAITGKLKDDPDMLKKFENNQKAWINYRDSKCELLPAGGELLQCLMEENKHKVEELIETFKDYQDY